MSGRKPNVLSLEILSKKNSSFLLTIASSIDPSHKLSEQKSSWEKQSSPYKQRICFVIPLWSKFPFRAKEFRTVLFTSVNVSVFTICTSSVDVPTVLVSGFRQADVWVDDVNVLLACPPPSDVRRRSTGLWPTFSYSSVSVSLSKPLQKQSLQLINCC